MNRRLVHKHGNIVEEDETKGDEKSFSVMQWNILAQTLAQNGMFQFATKEVLDWQHRKELIVKVTQWPKCVDESDFVGKARNSCFVTRI